jgi:hypothetical protein
MRQAEGSIQLQLDVILRTQHILNFRGQASELHLYEQVLTVCRVFLSDLRNVTAYAIVAQAVCPETPKPIRAYTADNP